MKYQAYLFVHFIGEGENGEQIYFSVSRDGLHWKDLNNGKPVIVSQVGEKGLRDPFILRNHLDGKFYIIATDLCIHAGKGWGIAQYEGSRNLMVMSSENLDGLDQSGSRRTCDSTGGMSVGTGSCL